MVAIWTPTGLVPRPLVLRMFLAERHGRYIAMPGGLTQVPHAAPGGIAALEAVLTSKDTWVLPGDDGDLTGSSRASYGSITIRTAPDELRSRIADDLFWLGRYTERLDNAAR